MVTRGSTCGPPFTGLCGTGVHAALDACNFKSKGDTMTDGRRFHKHLLYLERLHTKIDKSKDVDAARRGSRKKGKIITLASGAVKRIN
jgi:hypothetical protein